MISIVQTFVLIYIFENFTLKPNGGDCLKILYRCQIFSSAISVLDGSIVFCLRRILRFIIYLCAW